MDRFLIAPLEEGLRTDLKEHAYLDELKCHNATFKRRDIMRSDAINLTGQRFGMLLVVEEAVVIRGKGKGRAAYWRCLCDCGNYAIATGGNLRQNRRKSCGCLSERNIENTGLNILLGFYKKKAAARHIFFNLSRETFYLLIKGNCHYCGRKPGQIIHRNKTQGKVQILYNGIDRIVSDKGYQPDNCVSCCKFCNRLKADLTLEEFKENIKRMYQCLIDGSSHR